MNQITEQAIDLLREITIFSYRVDGWVTPEYERGWNDAIQHVSVMATAFLMQIGRNDPDGDTENEVDNSNKRENNAR